MTTLLMALRALRSWRFMYAQQHLVGVGANRISMAHTSNPAAFAASLLSNFLTCANGSVDS